VTNEIVVSQAQEMFMPVMNVQLATARRAALVQFTREIMVNGTDYGVVPGTGTKPTLLKPGAEKLVTFFGLTPVPVPVETVEDWTGENHGGEPFFYYRYKMELWRTGSLVAAAEGSCNSWETKYRYRRGERTCPKCGQATIIKGKAEYGGGWVCLAKKGGCGAKYKDGDKAIEGQDVGRVLNPDTADLVNTIQKMAQKRALVAAVLIGVNASEFYTQDVEDVAGDYVDATFTTVATAPAAQHEDVPPFTLADVPAMPGGQPEEPAAKPTNGKARPANGAAKPEPAQLASAATLKRLHALGRDFYGNAWDEQRRRLVVWMGNQRIPAASITSSRELAEAEAAHLADGIASKISARNAVQAGQEYIDAHSAGPDDNAAEDEAALAELRFGS